MKKIFLLVSLLLCICSLSVGQRIVEIVTDPMINSFDQIICNDHAYVAEQGGQKLRRHDGTTRFSINYPLRDGMQLEYVSKYIDGFLSYGTSVYQLLKKRSTSTKYLYRFNGTTFSSVPLPGNPVSNIVVYGDKIHLLINTTGGIKLVSYDGATVREVPSSLMPGTGYYNLISGGSRYLYIDGAVLKRYNGSSFRTISGIPRGGFKKVSQISGTEHAYFHNSYYVYYYDGVSVREVYNLPGTNLSGGLIWDGNFFFQAGSFDGIYPYKLYKCTGAIRTEITVPGTLISASDYLVYRDKLYFSIHAGGTDHIYSYDGSAFESFFDYPVVAIQPLLKIRRGNIISIPRPMNDNIAFEYNGEVFTEIQSPGEQWIAGSLESTTCNHYWSLAYFDSDPNVLAHRWVMAIERPNETCTAPAGGGVAIIPDRLRDFERVIISPYGPDRPWCWTGIDIDWEIEPICVTPPCPISRFQTTLTDKAGKIAWQKTFEKPFSQTFPVDDTQPYALSVGVEKNQVFGNVLLFDQEVVNKGFEKVVLDVFPKGDYFYLTVSTKKDEKVPFTLTLKNLKNESLWRKQFTAPLDELINTYVSKPGAYLQFSLQQTNATSNITYYPNPFQAKINIDVTNSGVPAYVSLSDMNGKIVSQKSIVTSGAHSLEAFNNKPGLYILTIKEGKTVRRELVELK